MIEFFYAKEIVAIDWIKNSCIDFCRSHNQLIKSKLSILFLGVCTSCENTLYIGNT